MADIYRGIGVVGRYLPKILDAELWGISDALGVVLRGGIPKVNFRQKQLHQIWEYGTRESWILP